MQPRLLLIGGENPPPSNWTSGFPISISAEGNLENLTNCFVESSSDLKNWQKDENIFTSSGEKIFSLANGSNLLYDQSTSSEKMKFYRVSSDNK